MRSGKTAVVASVVGALVAGALLWRTRNLALGILGGFAAYWLARVLGL